MAKLGPKGSDINVAQMIALVGQQTIGGQRILNGFQDRSLPHFHKHTRQPAAKGFVENSFYSGLTPTEFLFHAMSGRVGLVDTAVKTAETGYMSRRLMKSLEDLSIQYDDTVRTSGGSLVQFQYGADRLDPSEMEGSGVPVHFERTWTHAENLTRDHDERSLTPIEVREMTSGLLEKQRQLLVRRDAVRNSVLEYDDQTDYAIDEHESSRSYIKSIAAFIESHEARLRRVRDLPGPPGSTDNELAQARVDKTAKVSAAMLQHFIRLCLDKFRAAHCEPGYPVGAIGAQSISEPGTQMTLKTFHFAGVAGVSITQGVPRIKEIINASKTISTPIITCPLLNCEHIEVARVVKARMEKTYLSDVLRYAEMEWGVREGTIILQINTSMLADLNLGLDFTDITDTLCSQHKLDIEPEDISVDSKRICIRINAARKLNRASSARSSATASESGDLLRRANFLNREIPKVPICGHPEAVRALIETNDENIHSIVVEGYGLRACMNTEGVVGAQTHTTVSWSVARFLALRLLEQPLLPRSKTLWATWA